MSIDKLFTSFDRYIPLDEPERADLKERVIERKIKRRQLILTEDEVCRHHTFVVEGCFKVFQVDKKGVEHNLQFAAENDWIMIVDSFYSETKSKVNIEAIEPSTILQISRPDFVYFLRTYPKFDRNFRVIVETRFAELENRLLQIVSSTAEERYLAFLRQYPQLSQRLPNTQIASYLGITPEFLSTIRKEIAQRRAHP
ncbi:Crp/Fnr family transcriptional regulator [Chryseolinea soli]|uniref:Crp/Fnr family transcriptional regulator n=1 Tax=Chryseolinea soli TaxID=2321403 RepID=A0A385SXI8_9BACT|nr:Crp/Fnr family transcriptional regulator [Chryseolinea soli]AYB34735.1 Crp/Fnr family transcriptional regulator [Chryseolinea soli]